MTAAFLPRHQKSLLGSPRRDGPAVRAGCRGGWAPERFEATTGAALGGARLPMITGGARGGNARHAVLSNRSLRPTHRDLGAVNASAWLCRRSIVSKVESSLERHAERSIRRRERFFRACTRTAHLGWGLVRAVRGESLLSTACAFILAGFFVPGGFGAGFWATGMGVSI
jgi:hypothetical protein